MDICGRCGRRAVAGGWCEACRQPAAPAGPGHGGAPAPAGRPVSVPALLWVAIAGFGLAALLTAGGALSTLSSVGGFGLIVLLVPLIAALVLPAAYTAIAVGLYRGQRVARTAGVVIALTGLVAVPAGGYGSPAMVLGALLAVLAAVPPVLVPAIRAWFDGPYGSRPAQAPSITVARLILAVFAGVAAAGAIVSLLVGVVTLVSTAAVASSASADASELGDAFGGLVGVLGGAFAGVLIVGGLVGAGSAVLGFWARGAVGARSRVARVVVTVVAGLVVVGSLLALLTGGAGAVTTAHLVLNLALVVLLWVPTDARQHFVEPPLPLVEHLRHQMVLGIDRLSTPAPAFAPAAPFSGGFAPAGMSAPTVSFAVPTASPTPTGRHYRPDTSCTRCGAATTPGWQHCGHCGAPLG